MATDDWDGDDGAEWWSRLRGWLEIYEQLRPLYDGDFYPLTAYSLSSFDWLGWQLHRGDLKKGMLQLFRRGNATAPTLSFPVYGLKPEACYSLTIWDDVSDRRQHGSVRPLGAGNTTGAELRAGLAVTLPGPPRACTVDVAGVIDPRDNKTTLAGNSTLAWTPTACGSSAVVIYTEC